MPNRQAKHPGAAMRGMLRCARHDGKRNLDRSSRLDFGGRLVGILILDAG